MALNLEQYTKTQWIAEMPITADRMDNLEEGVRVNRDALINHDSVIDSIDTRISNRVDLVISGVAANAQAGLDAKTSIVEATTAHTPPYTSLAERLKGIDDALGYTLENGEQVPAYSQGNSVAQIVGDIQNRLGVIITEVQNAHINGVTRESFNSLSEHFFSIDSNINLLFSYVADINNSAGVGSTLAQRINQLQALQNEVDAARRAVAEGEEPDNLAKRFASIDTQISNLVANISSLQSNKVNKSDIIDDLIHTDTDKPLSANMGKSLRDIIGGTYTAGNTVANAIATASTTVEANARNYTDGQVAEIYAAHRDLGLDPETEEVIVDSLNKRFTDAETDISALQAELTAAHSSTAADATYNNLDARLEAIESAANSSRADINTIANELAMVDSESIVGTNTRVDTLEQDLRTMAAELNMLDGTAIVDTNTRIDDIETEIGNAHRTGSDTLDTRFDEIEAAISHVADPEDSTDLGGLTQRMTAVESLASSAKTTADAAATQASLNTLAGRVQTLEQQPKSATVVISIADFEALQANEENSTKDYLVGPDDNSLYKYYHIIETSSGVYEKVLISGGSGAGNSSGFVYTENEYNALVSKAENTDYYVLQNDGYHHYRWVGNREVEIDEPTKRYNIALETIESENGAINYLNFYEFKPGESNIINDDTDLSTILSNRTRHILLPSTGGGGSVNTMKITQVTPRNVYNAYNSGLPIKIRFFFTTGEAGEGASYNFSVNGTTILSESVNITSGDPENRSYSWPTENDEELSPSDAAALGFYEFDVTPYCQNIDTYSIKLTVALDSNESITAEANWSVQVINLNLVSNFTNNPTAVVGNQVTFTYIPTGNIEKTAHFFLNGTKIGTATIPARTNTTQTFNIPSQSAGAYKLEAYLTANNGAIRTASIYRDIIWYEADSSEIILASPYRGNVEEVTQYDILNIPYTVIGGNTSTYTVEYYVDDLVNSINEVTLSNTNNGVWTYQANLQEGNHTLMIKVGEESITFTLKVEALDIDIAQVTDNLAIDFNPSGITNSSSRRMWSNGLYNLSVSNNFDWYNGGYGSDSSGDYFLVKAGTRATFDYKMFKSYTKEVDGAMTLKSTVFRDGAEMKIIFKTSAVRNAEAVWFSNMGPNNDTSAAKDVGIQLNVHNGWLRTDAAEASNVKSYLYFPYSEEDRIELDININPETAPNAVYCMSYEDGCPSRAYPYKLTEGLYQISGEEAPITIGSDDCDVYIYRLKIYNAALDTEQVLRNFIADGKDVNTCIERYDRNSIYYDTQLKEYTPYEGPDTTLDPEKLAVKLPDVKILMLETPQFTTSKKDFVKDSSLRCIHAPGGKVYPSRGKEDNWYFGNGYHAGQGTTSDKYGDAGRNVDFLFNCDGTHNPSDKVKDEAFVPGYQSYVIKGYGTPEQEEPEYCTDWKGDSGKVSLTATSIPNNFFNMKVNIASSENVNNALFQKRYNDFLLYQSPAFLRDNRIKNDMEFVPAILFVRETKVNDQGQPVEHTEFADTNWHFYALGNIGDSKKTDYTRAYDPTDINEFTLEISDNNTNNSQFQTGVYMKNGVRTIEPYTIVDDVDDKGKLTGTQSAKSSEEDITLETTAYLYPINKETEWEAVDGEGKPINMRYWGLMNEKFDGDHSFEMRYAYLGNYRDGKLVNGDKTVANNILENNSNVWRAFYTWLVTSSNQQIQDEIDQWCVRRSMAHFYAFTLYYTMIDNRAKNTFWHFAKTGKHRIVSRPVPELLHIYEVADGEVTENDLEPGVWEGTFTVPDNTSEIVSGVTYYTQYAFDMWAYDMDTAAGIDNNGELIFPYGKEDTDDRVDGDATSGKVFNGAGSVFWARLRENFTSDITGAFTGVSSSCYNAENLIAEFDKVQNCYPEAIWRLDVERKYIRSFTGDDGSTEDHPDPIYLTRKNTRFLGDMMQGRKKYQRRQWIKDQGVYFGSKYKMSNISNNQFDMVCYTIADQSVMANWDLTITPYQDMYINVEYGETPIAPIRAKANVPVEIDCPFTSMNESRIRIYGADYIRALAGKPIKDQQGNIIGANSLASLYFRGNDFNHTNKLRELYIGSPDPTYNNSQFTTLNLNENSPILEVLDLQNCGGLSGALSVSGCTALKTINIQGTSYSSVDLPSSTGIENLYLSTTTSRLVLTAAKNLTNLTIRTRTGTTNVVDNLTELIVNDSDYSNNINWMTIAANALPHLTNLQLINLRLAAINDIIELEPFAERKETLGNFINADGNEVSKINLTGLVNVTGNWSQIEKDNYAGTPSSVWPNLNLNTTGTEQTKHKVTYLYNNKEYSIYVNENTAAPDPYAQGDIELPVKPSDQLYEYIFGSVNSTTGNYIPYSGWKIQGSSTPLTGAPMVQTSDITLEAYFQGIERSYAIRWFLDENRTQKVAEVREIPYGGGAEVLIPTVANIHEGNYMSTEGTYNQYETCSISVTDSGAVTYKIFEGWDKLPVNIHPDGTTDYFDIFAVWDEATTTVSEVFADVTDHQLTTKQLLVLSAMSENMKATEPFRSMIEAYDVSYQTSVQLGHDSSQSGNVIVSDETDALYLSGSGGSDDYSYSTNFQPFNDGAFTFVIDYTFAEDTATENTFSILASCYHSANNVKHGFGIFKNNTTNAIEVGFGNMYESASNRVVVNSTVNSTMRNIVVLRHPAVTANDTYERLYIYSSNGASTSITPNGVSIQTLQRTANANFTSNAYLNIGQLFDISRETVQSGDNYSNRVHAKAKVHWAKYWNYDIGAGECQMLASWPHEEITFGIAELNKNSNSINTSRTLAAPTPSLYLTSLNMPVHGLYTQSSITSTVFNTTTNSYSWRDTNLRLVCNNRIFNALPVELQAALMRPAVGTFDVIHSEGDGQGYGSGYQVRTTLYDTRDYVYAYSAANILDDNSFYELEDPVLSPFKWKNTSVIAVYDYSTTNNNWNAASSISSNYLNIRFPYKPITWGLTNKLRIYRVSQLSNISANTVALSIGRENIRSGDILIAQDQAYIYISNKEINRYGLYPETDNQKLIGIPDSQATQIDSSNLGSGGWIRAERYCTRSLIASSSRAQLVDVSVAGLPNTSTVSSGTQEYKLNFIITL